MADLLNGELWCVGVSSQIRRSYDGIVWSYVDPSPHTGNYYACNGINVNDIWFANHGAYDYLHWDGSAFTRYAALSGPLCLEAVATDHVWCGGGSAASPPDAELQKWNGSSWQNITEPPYMSSVRNIWAYDQNNAFAVARYKELGAIDHSAIYYWNGTVWTKQWDSYNDGPFAQFHAVWGTSPTNVYVGGYCTANQNYRLCRWNGTTLTPLGSGISGEARVIRDIHGTADDNWYFVSILAGKGSWTRWNGSSFSHIWWSNSSSSALEANVTIDVDKAWAVGWYGRILEWNGSTVVSRTSGTSSSLQNICYVPPVAPDIGERTWSFTAEPGPFIPKIYPMLIGGVRDEDETPTPTRTYSLPGLARTAQQASEVTQEFSASIYPMIQGGIRGMDEVYPKTFPEPEPIFLVEDEMSRLPRLTWVDAATIGIAAPPGNIDSPLRYRCQDGLTRTLSPAGGNWSPTSVGEWGLDVGTEAASTWYYLYLIQKSGTQTELVAQGSTVSPLVGGPGSESNHIYIGSVFNDASSNLMDFDHVGNRFMQRISRVLQSWSGTGWDASIQTMDLDTIITGGAVPKTAGEIGISYYLQPAGTAWGSFNIYVYGEMTQWLNITEVNHVGMLTGSVPIPGSSKRFDYQRVQGSGNHFGSDIRMLGWIDEYLP